MSKVKDFFAAALDRVTGRGRRGTAKDHEKIGHASAGEPAKAAATVSSSRKKEQVYIRKSQRERKFGVARKDGRWLTPWDLYIMHKVQGMEILNIRQTFGMRAITFVMAYLKYQPRPMAPRRDRRASLKGWKQTVPV